MNKFLVILLTTMLFSLNGFSQSEKIQRISETIYQSDTVTWFGADFSLFRLINGKKVGQEEKLSHYFDMWHAYYNVGLSNVKIARMISVKKVFNDKTFTDNAQKEFLSEKWIIDSNYKVSEVDIEKHLKNYTSDRKGLGLTFIVESFTKADPSTTNGYFVWFDIESKKILGIFEESEITNPHPTLRQPDYKLHNIPKHDGMTIYWWGGMIDCTISFSTHYKDLDPFKKEEQY